jgi:capsule polysaccharide export protein KpsC/LpsZ
MDTAKLRKLAERCREQAKVETTLKTAQVIEAMTGLATLNRKLRR